MGEAKQSVCRRLGFFDRTEERQINAYVTILLIHVTLLMAPRRCTARSSKFKLHGLVTPFSW